MNGKFIVVEGLEGAGKSSVIGLIVDALKNAGKSVEQTREPGGTPMAEAIRDCVKHDWDEKVSEETELRPGRDASCVEQSSERIVLHPWT